VTQALTRGTSSTRNRGRRPGSVVLALQARKAVDLSQRRFADLIGVSNAAVSRWEAGVDEPSGAAQSLLLLIVADPSAAMRVLGR
jgi:DNA-binding transcriptional regulator YiaG